MTTEAGRALLADILELAGAFHQVGSLRDHADPTDKTGWNVHGIETCEDVYCVDALASEDAIRAIEAEVEERIAAAVRAKRYDPERGMGQRGWNAALTAVLAAITERSTPE